MNLESLLKIHQEGYKDKKLRFSFTTNIPAIDVNIDQLKIESVLENLISNACKFSAEQGEINLSINYEKNKQEIKLKVTDLGLGIAKEDIPHITERFYQSKKTKQHTEGTGVGLYLVKNYVELHGGQLNIYSTETQGTTVTFTLPVQSDDMESAGNVTPVGHSPENRYTVLIVDDNQEIADFLSLLLSPKYHCKVVHNGKNGLEMSRTLMPDLIISDIMMPVMGRTGHVQAPKTRCQNGLHSHYTVNRKKR